MRSHKNGEIRTSARQFNADQITTIYRRGTPYTRLMQIHCHTRTTSKILGKDFLSVGSGFRSLVSTGFCQWSLMRNYWCYSGPRHEQMIVRRLPLSTAIKIEIGGHIMYPILNAKRAAADWIVWSLPRATRNAINKLNPIRIIRDRRDRNAWDNLFSC